MFSVWPMLGKIHLSLWIKLPYKWKCFWPLNTLATNWVLLSRIPRLHSIMATLLHTPRPLFAFLIGYYFKLNFWILFQLNISSFEKSIFRALLVTKIQILINLLPLSSGQAFSLFSFIFNYFHGFLDFQQVWTNFKQASWFQTMEFTEPIHAKAIKASVGAQHPWYFLQYFLFDI